LLVDLAVVADPDPLAAFDHDVAVVLGVLGADLPGGDPRGLVGLVGGGAGVVDLQLGVQVAQDPGQLVSLLPGAAPVGRAVEHRAGPLAPGEGPGSRLGQCGGVSEGGGGDLERTGGGLDGGGHRVLLGKWEGGGAPHTSITTL